MKIAYLSVDDPKDYISWSGLKLNIYKTLKLLNHNITIVGPLRNLFRFPFVIKREFFKLFKLKYESNRNIFLSKLYAKKINKILKNKKIDLIFTSDTYLVSLLDTKIPIVLWLDTTYESYSKHYFSKHLFHKQSFQEANYLEQLALKKAKKIIVTSKWAKSETIKYYKIDPDKIQIIPFGSNLKNIKKINYKKKDNLDLVSVGVDWKRKGMDKSIKIAELLNSKGLKTNLTIVGATNSKVKSIFVKQTGFLNKNNYKDYLKLKRILLNSDFHLLMTKKEACGVVFAEANSFGLFNVTNKVGGVDGMIKNNVNGKLFNVSAKPHRIADYIIKIFKNKSKFNNLKKLSKNYYSNKLSWDINSKILQKILISIKN